MADQSRKKSNWVGEKRTDIKQYISDLDRDIKNLFEEKRLNLRESKRYSMAVNHNGSA